MIPGIYLSKHHLHYNGAFRQTTESQIYAPEKREQNVNGQVLGASYLEENAQRRQDNGADQTWNISPGESHCDSSS